MKTSNARRVNPRKTILSAVIALMIAIAGFAAKFVDRQTHSSDITIDVEIRDQVTGKAIKNATVHIAGTQANTDGSGTVHFTIPQEKLQGARVLADANCYQDNSANLTGEQQHATIVIELLRRADCFGRLERPTEPSTEQLVRPQRQLGSARNHYRLPPPAAAETQANPQPPREASLIDISSRATITPPSSAISSSSGRQVFLKFHDAPPVVQKWQQYLKMCLQRSGFYIADHEEAADFVFDCPGCVNEDESFTISFSDRKNHSERPYLLQKKTDDNGYQVIEPDEALEVCSDVQPSSPGNAAVPAIGARTRITGAGSTFAAPIYREWAFHIALDLPELRLIYQPVGSANGIELLRNGFVTFSDSDILLDSALLQSFHTGLLQVPVAAGAVAIVYNIDGVSSMLRFTPATLAKIFSGKIKKWNDPIIEAENPDITLPPLDITVIHRKDGSGTTFVFSRFLTDASPDWKGGVGLKVSWPSSKEAAGSGGVAQMVHAISGSIGYVEYTYAVKHKLLCGYIRNRAGRWILPDPDSISAAIPNEGIIPDGSDEATELLLRSDNKDAYPISSLTFLIFPLRTSDHSSREEFRVFLTWILTAGQDYCAGLKYGRLPRRLADGELQRMSTVLR